VPPNKFAKIRNSNVSNLAAAKNAKEDEFYTQLADIERELAHYRDHFQGKVIYCNCDDPRASGFVHYFSHNFEHLGIERLLATCYKSQNLELFSHHDSENAIKLEYLGDQDGSGIPDPNEFEVQILQGDGDFRSQESIDLLMQSDIVVTNPPFSLYREFIGQMMKHDKKFILVGPQNNVTTKDMFPLIMQGKVWLGSHSGSMRFRVPDDRDLDRSGLSVDENGTKWQDFGNICWFTNLDFPKRHEDLILFKPYSPDAYPKYDNFDAIEVSKVSDIPVDYFDVMGVPITFLDKHNPDQFEILGITKTWFGAASRKYPKQLQFDKNGLAKEVTKLNDGAVLKVNEPPKDRTYYQVGDGYYIQTYPRILVRRKGRK
jgi:hypothetical protein